MAENRLDQIVKGAPAPSAKPPPTTPLQNISPASTPSTSTGATTPPPTSATTDPLSNLPSSPPQIYLNLLILESSLRAQYLQLLSRRRLHTFFILLLTLWTGTFSYLLFLRPREDGLGLGGSVYWVVETTEKMALLGGVVTIVLFVGTGLWERGIRWPRRWVGTSNRGLRGFNLRVVVVRGPWWKEWPRHLAFLFPMMNLQSSGSDWHFVEYSSGQHGGRHQHPHHRSTTTTTSKPLLPSTTATPSDSESTLPPQPTTRKGGLIEEDLAPGGDYIKLLLLPKSFSPDFRENWEGYRTDYWERENERRAVLRRKSRQQRRARAQTQGGWMWWTGLWRTRRHNTNTGGASGGRRDLERAGQGGGSAPSSLRGIDGKSALLPGGSSSTAGSRRRSFLRSDSSQSHSRQSSRSSTPALEYDEKERALGAGIGIGIGLGSEVPKRGSSTSSAGTRRKTKERGGTGTGGGGRPTLSPLTRADEAKGERERPGTAGSGSDGGGGGGSGSWGRNAVYA